MPELPRLIVVGLVVWAANTAVAMGIRTTRTLLARSGDGAALYEVRQDGPEGGGALTYRVEGKGRVSPIEFQISSDFSPGDGSQPQRVSVKECEQRIAALGAELTRRKIPGVAVHPEQCRAKDRDGLVVVATSPR